MVSDSESVMLIIAYPKLSKTISLFSAISLYLKNLTHLPGYDVKLSAWWVYLRTNGTDWMQRALAISL